ncbi:radical SAM protein [Syntrophotalea acetylenivorans]|uniref:Radical SAM protein n=1 Tax=Syntrophotalea acetylenivorans TaxID=1842532 RepID=A0A1L3GLJ6_9BACT|nr:TatD family hydrolase [Syntrophotalea acetylenivorans]APG26794.1 radical SAM protein [Syntrophotalea acetylenivorans]
MNNNSPALIDTHAHLDSKRFADDLPQVIEAAKEAGVNHILTIGCDLASSRASVELAKTYSEVYAAVGIHPHDAREATIEAMDQLKTLAQQDKVVAIGEMGLDYYRDHCPHDIQQMAFRRQIALAREVGLPIIVHDREAHQDVLQILREEQAKQVGGVLHCFSGDLAMAQACIDMGFYISFPGTLTYPANQALRDVAEAISTDHVLLETDCPYLAPQPCRGKRNEPAFVRYTAEELARIKGLSLADIARITRLNTFRLFGIGEPDQNSRIAYPIRDALYLNITNRCSNQCVFCAKFKDFTVKGHALKLKREPTVEEIKRAVGSVQNYREVVFCGYGEPLLRLDLVKEVAAWLHEQGVRVRINTDGQANLVHQRNILPELAGLVDAISVSLNAANAADYQRICQSDFGEAGYEAVKDFLREAKKHIPSVTASVVTLPGIDVESCRKIVEEELGVKFLIRKYNEVG